MQKKYFLGLIILVGYIYLTSFVFMPAITYQKRQVTSQVESVVGDFYSWYLSYQGNPLSDRAYRSNPNLSSGLIEQINDLGQTGFQADPFLCAQDRPRDITLEDSTVSGDQASVQVNSAIPNYHFTVRLIQQDEAWMIDEVLCSK